MNQATGEVLSVFQAVLRGLIDYETGIRLLEAQLVISGLISPELRTCFDLQDAKSHGLIDEQILCQLKELNEVKQVLSTASRSTIPVLHCLAQGVISEPMAVRVLEILLSADSLVVPATGEHLTLQKAFQQNLISSALFSKVLERQNTCKDLIDPCTYEKVSLTDMVQRSILQANTGIWLLPVRPQETGRITLKCGRSISVLRAAHEGLIDRETMFRLLGAQILSGGLVNCNSGQKMTVEEAMAEGMIDRDTASSILTYQLQTGGIMCSNPAKRLTVDEAVQCDLITSSSALLVLEAQRGYVGLIWPHSGEIFPTSSSLEQELITNELAYKILNGRQKIAALYIPESSQVIDLDVAKQLGIIDNNTASILKNITLPDKMPDLGDLEACKNAKRWLSFCKFQPSTVHDYRQEEDGSDGEESVTIQSSEQTKKLFLSYLMVNSYMDANTGQRLLLYDGDLDEAVGMLLESCSSELGADTSVKESLSVLSIPGASPHYASSKEKDKYSTPAAGSDKCPFRQPEHKEALDNRERAINEELCKPENNDNSSELYWPENLMNTTAIVHKGNSPSSVCVPKPASYSTQPEFAEGSMLRHDSDDVLQDYKNQSELETKVHLDERNHSKITQDFAGSFLTSKTGRLCNWNERENEDNMQNDSPVFDYSPRLSALLSHDELRHSQGRFSDPQTPQNVSYKGEASPLSFNDQKLSSDTSTGEKFQDQFLGIAAINISFQGQHSGQRSLEAGCGDPQEQYHSDEYMSDASGEHSDESMSDASGEQSGNAQPTDENEKSASTVEERSCTTVPGDGSCRTNTLSPGGAIGADDYETSLLADQQSDTGTDTESDDYFYDTPLFEDDDHDSLVLQADDHDCLHPEDYDMMQEENDGTPPPADVSYDVSKEKENPLFPQGGRVDGLSVTSKVHCSQELLVGMEKPELHLVDQKQCNSVGSDKVNEQLVESISKRENLCDLDNDGSDSLTDGEIIGRKEGSGASLTPDGSRRGRREEFDTSQESQSDTDHGGSEESRESYGHYICDDSDSDDDDSDAHSGDYSSEDGGGGGGGGQGVEDENGRPMCQVEDTQLCAPAGKERGDGNQSLGHTVLGEMCHTSVLQPQSTGETNQGTERSNHVEIRTGTDEEKKASLSNHMATKDTSLPGAKHSPSEKIFGSVLSDNTGLVSELERDVMNTKVKLVQGPESTNFLKAEDGHLENVSPQINPSSDKAICSGTELLGGPSEESQLSSTVNDKGQQGSGRSLVKGRDSKNDPLVDETSIQDMGLGKEGLIEGPGEEERYLNPFPNTRAAESLTMTDRQFLRLMTDTEELSHRGDLKAAAVILGDESENVPRRISASPVPFETLAEIFDTSASKVTPAYLTSDAISSEVKSHVGDDAFTGGLETESGPLSSLEHGDKRTTAGVLEPNKNIPSCVSVVSPPLEDDSQTVNNAEEKSVIPREDWPPGAEIQQSDPCSRESVSEGKAGTEEVTTEHSDTTLSPLPLKSVEDCGDSTGFVPSKLRPNGVGNSAFESSREQETTERRPHREPAFSPRLHEREVRAPECSLACVDDGKSILQSVLEEGHVNLQEGRDPSACTDTRISIQNLLKRVDLSQLPDEVSGVPSPGISPMNNSSELKAESGGDPLCIESLQLELLDILKQNQHTPGTSELIEVLTQMECDPKKKGIASELFPPQLKNAFRKVLIDGNAAEREQAEASNWNPCAASELVEEKPYSCSDLQSKEGSRCSLSSQTVRDTGAEHSAVHTAALPRGEKLEELCSEPPGHSEYVSVSKAMASGDSSVEKVS